MLRGAVEVWLQVAVAHALLSAGIANPSEENAGARWAATFWQPTPYTQTRGPDAALPDPESLRERSRRLDRVEEEIRRREEAIAAQETSALGQVAHLEEWWRDLERRDRTLGCERYHFQEGWAEQETSLLHLIVFRLVRIQASAAEGQRLPAPGAALVSAAADVDGAVVSSPSAQGPGERRWSKGPGEPELPELARWAKVEIVACLRGSLKAVAGEIPVYSILRASTPLGVTDICRHEEADGGGTLDLLTLLVRFFQAQRALQEGPLPTLFVVVAHGVNVFFNEMRDIQTDDVLSERLVAAEYIRRYEAAVADGVRGDGLEPAVAAVERACRRTAVLPCTAEEAQQSPYLHAAGLAGSAVALERVIGAMIVLAEEQKAAGQGLQLGEATVLLRRVAQQWPGSVVPDTQQALFGSFIEVEAGLCEGATTPPVSGGDKPGAWCSPEPCCPLNHQFKRLHEAYYSRFREEGCALRRIGSDSVPLLWHGDGLAKWTYALAMHSMAATCPYIARLVLQCHPADMLEHLFDRFEATQKPGSVAKRPAVDPDAKA